ncbi:MAG: class I adenylate-forming enzyme family protein [Candidatus Solibacter sp.]|jgi:acyl-CoA synthetase (AMP-forming)/AMP-acid ligase II
MIPISEAIGCAPLTVADLLDWPARLYPARVAIQGSEALTFEELRERSVARSEVLAKCGVGRFQRWGLIAENSADFFVTLFALARLGAVSAPIQHNQTGARLSHAVSGARLSGVIAPPHYHLPAFDETAPLVPALASTGFDADGHARIFGTPPAGAPARRSPLDVDPALIIWSSGSTRAARGVVLQHYAVLANIRSNVAALGLRDDDRTMVVLPVAHAYALIHQCLCHLAVGAAICCPQQPLLAPSLCRQLEECEITTLTLAPPVLNILLEGLRRTRRACPRLRLVTVGASRANRDTLAEAMDLLPHARFAITYGLTEAGPRVATGFVDRQNIDPACVGAPLPNMEIFFRKSADGASEICVRGRSLMRSYADAPWEEGADHSLGTSDLGEISEGRLYVRGRLDRAINHGGVLIAAEPIEEALLRHPAVERARVESRPHPFWGEAPVATLSFRAGHTPPSIDELRQFCARSLSREEIPARFEVGDGTLPVPVKDRAMLSLVGERPGELAAAHSGGSQTS